MVPFRSAGAISAMNARSTPAVIAVNKPYSENAAHIIHPAFAQANSAYTAENKTYPPTSRYLRPTRSDRRPNGSARSAAAT